MKPSFIDLQVNGHGGVDLLSARSVAEIRKVSRSLYQNGVAGYLATIITAPVEVAVRAIKLIEEVRKNPEPGEALILGVHLEGPFISKIKRGVHPEEFVKNPDIDHINKLLAAGEIKEVTLAPELPGAIDLIKYLVSKNIVVSLGHSNATYEEAVAGFDAGAKTITHLYNAMAKTLSDVIGKASLERSEILIQLIVDDVHIAHDLLIETMPKLKGRYIMTNDPMAAAGLGNGEFPLGDMNIMVKDGVARRADGTLAGGVATLADSLEILDQLGISYEDAIASVTTRPCQLIGVDYNSIINRLN